MPPGITWWQLQNRPASPEAGGANVWTDQNGPWSTYDDMPGGMYPAGTHVFLRFRWGTGVWPNGQAGWEPPPGTASDWSDPVELVMVVN